MLPQRFEPIEEDVSTDRQGLQPYFEHILWSDFCCGTIMEEIYINIIEKKLVCNECYSTRLTFSES